MIVASVLAPRISYGCVSVKHHFRTQMRTEPEEIDSVRSIKQAVKTDSVSPSHCKFRPNKIFATTFVIFSNFHSLCSRRTTILHGRFIPFIDYFLQAVCFVTLVRMHSYILYIIIHEKSPTRIVSRSIRSHFTVILFS